MADHLTREQIEAATAWLHVAAEDQARHNDPDDQPARVLLAACGERDQAAADAVQMAHGRLGDHVDAMAQEAHGPYQRIGCLTCDAAQAVIDRWGVRDAS